MKYGELIMRLDGVDGVDELTKAVLLGSWQESLDSCSSINPAWREVDMERELVPFIFNSIFDNFMLTCGRVCVHADDPVYTEAALLTEEIRHILVSEFDVELEPIQVTSFLDLMAKRGLVDVFFDGSGKKLVRPNVLRFYLKI